LVERFLSDTLSDAERAAFVRATSEAERVRLRAAHEALSAELLGVRQPAEFARIVRARAERERAARRKPGGRALVLAAALLAALALVSRDALRQLDADAVREQGSDRAAPGEARGSAREQTVASERAKGLAPSLRVYRKRADGPQLLAQGERVQAGDVLQLGYVAPGMSYAVLVSIDGRAQVTLHFPGSAELSTKLGEAQGEQLLPAAYELDDAPRFERFVLVTSRRPLSAAEVLRAASVLARRGESALSAALALPAHAEQVSVLLSKGGP
jgi:hypothetical protein